MKLTRRSLFAFLAAPMAAFAIPMNRNKSKTDRGFEEPATRTPEIGPSYQSATESANQALADMMSMCREQCSFRPSWLSEYTYYTTDEAAEAKSFVYGYQWNYGIEKARRIAGRPCVVSNLLYSELQSAKSIWMVDEERLCVLLYRKCRDSQVMYNYLMSQQIERIPVDAAYQIYPRYAVANVPAKYGMSSLPPGYSAPWYPWPDVPQKNLEENPA